MFLSVLKTIQQVMPENEIHMIVKSPVEQNLIEAVGGVSRFYYYDPLNHSARSIAKLILDLRKNKYDLSISHIGTNALSGAALMKAAGVKVSIGSSNGKKPVNYTIPIDTSGEPHRARKNALLLKGLGIEKVKETGLLNDLQFKGKVAEQIRNALGKDSVKIGIAIGTGNTVIRGVSVNGKKWPDEHWLKLIDMILQAGHKVLLFGGNKEKKERSSGFEALPSEDVMDLVGKLQLSESLEALHECDLFIACDTGMGFCSALMDIPTISLLGPSGPMLASPYGTKAEYIFLGLDCSPCYGTERMRDCKNRRCMNEITPEMVFRKSMKMLGKEE